MAQNDDARIRVETFVKGLASATQLCRMYGEKHSLTEKASGKLYDMLKDIFNLRDEITIGVIGDEIAFEKEPFYDASQQIQKFIQHLKEISAYKISFLKGASGDELKGLVRVLSVSREVLDKYGSIQRLAEDARLRNIVFGEIGYKKANVEEITEYIEKLSKKNFEQGERVFEEFAKSIREDKTIDLRNARMFINNVKTNLVENRSSLLILTSVKSHDEYSYVHNINVAVFTLLQAEALELGGDHLADIGIAALLHDVGKLSIPAEVLRKKEKLTAEDMKIIERHPVYGAKIILEMPDINPLAAVTAFEHHVKYDNTGYPERLFAGKVNLVTMMITIADFYDAMRSKRAYREEMAPEKTYEEMKSLAGKHLNPDLLDLFFSIIGMYPPGTLVELDTKETGLVVKENPTDIKRPQVEVLYDAKAELLKEPFIADLQEQDRETGKYLRTVVRSINPSDKIKIPEKYQG